uniref:Uncharacterized protein n=1 Tax=Pristionchus pacificus TaxID=54126 RepID=A0A2A6C256_PRIPA|eukprot:PDM72189.1 hypothetical protein PRIPAC_38623 [Pristionchus pacificus]
MRWILRGINHNIIMLCAKTSFLFLLVACMALTMVAWEAVGEVVEVTEDMADEEEDGEAEVDGEVEEAATVDTAAVEDGEADFSWSTRVGQSRAMMRCSHFLRAQRLHGLQCALHDQSHMVAWEAAWVVGEDEEEWVDTEDMEDELEDGEAEDDGEAEEVDGAVVEGGGWGK